MQVGAAACCPSEALMKDNMIVQIARVDCVSDADKEQMFIVLQSYFSNLKIDVFMNDMSEKNWVIIMREGSHKIFGFSTIQLLQASPRGEPIVYVFSGDTIVDREYWQYNMLTPAFGFFMLRMIEDFAGTPVYWFLISKGYRTYRFLPTYFNIFYPTYDKSTPPEYDLLLRHICNYKFGDHYDPGRGIVSFNGHKDHLNNEMCQVPETRKNNPHIKFFLERNPDYRRGDELACIADISRENLNRKAYRIMEGRSVEWVE
jgi:hypothetical protein